MSAQSLQRRLRALALVLPLAIMVPQAAQAQAFAKVVPTASQAARLAALKAAAGKLDAFTDPRAFRAAQEAVLAFAKTIYPEPHPELEQVRLEIHFADYLLGNNQGLIEKLEKGVAVFEAGGPAWRETLIGALNNLAVICDQTGHSERSAPLLEKAIAYWRETVPPEGSKDLGIGISNLAWSYRSSGQYDKALPAAREAIAMLEALHARAPQDKAVSEALTTSTSNLSIHLADLGRKAEAVDVITGLAARLDRLVGADSPTAANALVNGAFYIVDQGKYAEAEAMARRAIAIRAKALGEDAGPTAEAELALIAVLTVQGRYRDAAPIAEHAARVLTEKNGPVAPQALEARGKLARIAFALGDQERGLAEIRAMVAQAQAKYPASHRDVIDNQEFLAQMLGRAGRWEEVRSVLADAQRGRALAKAEQSIPAASAQALMALAEARTGRQAEARARLDAAMPRLVSFLDRELRDEGARGARHVALNRAVGWATLAAGDSGDTGRAFALVQHFGLGPSDRAVLRARARDQAGDPQVSARLRLVQDKVEQRSQAQKALEKAAAEGNPEAARQARALVDGLTAEIAPLQAASTAEAFAVETLPGLQARLAADEAVYLSFETDFATRIFVISARSVAMTDAALPTSRIRELAGALRRRLDWGLASDAAFDTRETDALQAALFTPEVERVLAGKRQIAVIAKGALSRLPFAVLTRTRPGGARQWAVERFAFSHPVGLAGIGAGRGLGGGMGSGAARGGSRRQLASFVGIGAPALPQLAAAQSGAAQLRAFRGGANGAKIGGLGPLGLADGELRGMAAAMAARETRILSGAQATEAGLRSLDLGQADVLTFATHGLMAGELENLDEAALVLSPPVPGEAGSDADDGLLTTSEIARMRLKARLVVLSACNSASGDGANDEALGGLAHAFLYAGAQGLLVSHWRVRDDAAARLTVATARGTASGLAPAEALRRAQLSLIRDSSVPGAAHPALWAPFVLVGE